MNNKSGSEKIALECTRCGATTVPTKYVSYREIQKYQRNHHTLCNSSPNHPIGASGGSCSCRVVHNSEWRDLQKLCEEQKREIEIQDEQRQKLLDLHMKEEAALQSQLATQTERVRVLEEGLKSIELWMDATPSMMRKLAKLALNQERLGDGGKGE